MPEPQISQVYFIPTESKGISTWNLDNIESR